MNDDDDDDVSRYAKNFDPADAPLLDNIEKRWNKMDQMDQEDVIMYLQYKEKGDWKELSDVEKKAIWYINYGPWGPRSSPKDDPGVVYQLYGAVVFWALFGVGLYKGYHAWATSKEEGATEQPSADESSDSSSAK